MSNAIASNLMIVSDCPSGLVGSNPTPGVFNLILGVSIIQFTIELCKFRYEKHSKSYLLVIHQSNCELY